MIRYSNYKFQALEKIAALPISIATPLVHQNGYERGDSTFSGMGDGRFIFRFGNPVNLLPGTKFHEGIGTITSDHDDYRRPPIDLKNPDVPIYYVISGANEGNNYIGTDYDDILKAAPPGHVQMYRWQDQDRMLKDIYANPKNQKISILGHSFGGSSALDVSDALAKKGYRIETLDTIDPVGTKPGGLWGLISWLPGLGNRSVREKPSNVRSYRNINGDDPLFGSGARYENWLTRLGGKVRVDPKFNNGEGYTNLVNLSGRSVLSHDATWLGYREVIRQRERERLQSLQELAAGKDKAPKPMVPPVVQNPPRQIAGGRPERQFPSNLLSSVSFAAPRLTGRQAPSTYGIMAQ